MRIETLAIHAGQDIDPATGSVIPPIYLTTTFEREADGSYPQGYIYTRLGNPLGMAEVAERPPSPPPSGEPRLR